MANTCKGCGGSGWDLAYDAMVRCERCQGTGHVEPEIVYLDPPYVLEERPLAWQRAGLQETATGYGRKLTTRFVLRIQGLTNTPARWYRVYCVCYSNAGSHYILRGGTMVFLRDSELSAARDKTWGIA